MTESVALRWSHPDLELGPPGLAVSASGRLMLARGRDAVRQSLLMLLSTNPGERVMRPQYGCDLQRLLFWPNDATTAGLAIHYVRRAVQRFEPRVEVLAVEAEPAADSDSQLNISLAYRVRADRSSDVVQFDLELGVRR